MVIQQLPKTVGAVKRKDNPPTEESQIYYASMNLRASVSLRTEAFLVKLWQYTQNK